MLAHAQQRALRRRGFPNRGRLGSTSIPKTNAVTSKIEYEMSNADVRVGPSDHVPWLENRTWCYVRIEDTTFGNVPLMPGDEARGMGLTELHRRGESR